MELLQKRYELLCQEAGEEDTKTLDALHKLEKKEFRVQGAKHEDTWKADMLVRSLRKKLGQGDPKRGQRGLLGAIRSLFGKTDGKQN